MEYGLSEMVNPNSELYQQHPDWIVTQLKAGTHSGRYQEILDLTRPDSTGIRVERHQ